MAAAAVEESDRQALHNISIKLTEDVLLEVLQTFTKRKDVRVCGYKVRPATSQGDNYQSTVSRVTVEGTSTTDNDKYTLSLIIKSLTPNICRRKTFRTVEFFANEVAFYEKVWSKLLEFQEKVKPKEPFTGIPRCYKALADGENDFIILEDLAPAGYRIPPRMEGLDYAHCSKILPVLARFHALSLAFRDQDPDTFQEVANSVQEIYYKAEIKPWYENFLHNLISVAMDAMAKEMPSSIYEEKLRLFTAGDLYSHITKLVADSKEPHGVISHGDIWTANLMCCYPDDSTNPLDAKLIDFQLTRCSSPALDLSSFFFSCTRQDVREQHYDSLVQEYHAAMSQFLAELGSRADKVYSLATLQRELAKYSKYGFCMALEGIPLIVMDEDDTVVDVELKGDEAVPVETVLVARPIKRKEGRLRMCNNIKHMVDHGYL